MIIFYKLVSFYFAFHSLVFAHIIYSRHIFLARPLYIKTMLHPQVGYRKYPSIMLRWCPEQLLLYMGPSLYRWKKKLSNFSSNFGITGQLIYASVYLQIFRVYGIKLLETIRFIFYIS